MQKILYTVIIAVVFSLPAEAITDKEKSEFLRLHNELASLDSIIEQAEQSLEESDRQHVNYQSLRNDLNIIKQGVQAVIQSRRREPRVLPPLTGEYH